MLLPYILCKSLVAGGRLLGAEQQAMRGAATVRSIDNAC